jgi:N-acyl-D-aspartate/D-glutamate deacylase
MSKDLFMQLREQEIANLYPADFTKKEAVEAGKNFIKQSLESGLSNKYHLGANLARLSEVLASALSEFKEAIKDDEKRIELGVEFSTKNGYEKLNYSEDEIWSELNKSLKEREDLLKLAYKSSKEIFDNEGWAVPKVSATMTKSSVNIKF